ncbi:MAG: HYR domain-containing protein [Bacteroidota bacterium]
MQKKIYLLSAFLLFSFFRLAAQTSLSLPSQTVNCGEQLIIPVTVGAGFDNINGVSFSVGWDPAALRYDTSSAIPAIVLNPNNPQSQFNTQNTANGRIGFFWSDVTNEITLAEGDTILLLTYTVIGNNFGDANLNFFNSPTIISAGTSVNNMPTDIDLEIANGAGTLTLVDTETPVFTDCPRDQSATTVSGSTSEAVANLTPTATDNCGVDSITYVLTGATMGAGNDDASGQLFNIGTTTVTYTAKDFEGNNTNCAFDVVVTAGTVGGNDNLLVRAGSVTAQCGSSVKVPVNVVGFDEITDLAFTITFDTAQFTFDSIADIDLAGLALSNFDLSQSAMGTISLTWDNALAQTKADEAVLFTIGLSSTAALNNAPVTISNLTAQQNNVDFPAAATSGTVTFEDNIDPTIECPSDQVLSAAFGALNRVVDNIDATAMDNCGSTSLAYALTGATTASGPGSASGNAFNVGVTTVTYTATDESGNMVDCSFTVTVDGDAPTDFTLIAESATAACDGDYFLVDINVGAFDTIGALQFSVNWDPAVLSFEGTENSIFTENVLFGDSEVANGNLGFGWFDFGGRTFVDGTTIFSIRFSPVAGGTTSVNFNANTPTPLEVSEVRTGIPREIPLSDIVLLSGTVEITDTVKPTIGCPADQTIMVAEGVSTAVVNDLDPIVTDNCGVAAVEYTLSGATVGSGMDSASGATFNVGTTTLTYVATDGAGNTDTCTTTVIIESPGAMTVNVVNEAVACGTEPYKVDITVDDFRNGIGIQFSVNWSAAVLRYDSLDFNQGLANIVVNDFKLDDVANGILGFAWVDGNFTPEDLPDSTILFSIFYSLVGDNGTNTTIAITDDPVLKEGTVVAADGRPVGVPLIGNSSQIAIQDNDPPVVVIPFPDTITLFVTADACTAVGEWTDPTFVDDCSNNLTIIRSIDPGVLLPVGDTILTYTATDPSGNSISNSTTLIIRDTIAPVLVGCPDDLTVTADENCQAVVTWTPPTATDNCELTVISSTHNPGTVFNQPITVVTYTAEDAFGNQATCSFTVTVEGVSPIVFESFPGNITVNAAQGQCGANIGWTEPTATGGCNADTAAIIIVAGDATPGDFFPVGTTVITYTAADAAGQSITDSFTVTVIDNQELTVICPTDIQIQADGTVLMDEANFINSITSDTCGTYVITYNDIVAFDNCSPVTASQVQGPASGSQFTFGTTTMEFVLSDTLGNTRNCTFQIIINETNDLAATTLDDPTCAGSPLRLSVNSLIGGEYQWTGPGGFIAEVQSPVILNPMTQNSGEYVVKVVSENGCTIKDSIMVGILSAPEIEARGTDFSCTADSDTIRLFVEPINGIPIETYAWTGPGGFSTDVQNPILPNATNSAVGQYIVTGTSSNGCSNMDTVVVGLGGMVMPAITTDTDADTICANSPITLTGTAYDGTVTYTWLAPDGSGLPMEVDTNVIVATPTAAGTYTYEFTANLDGNCTSDTARVTFVVIDGAGAIVLGSNGPFDCADLDQTVDLTAMGGVDIVSYAWTGPNDFSSEEQNPSIAAANAVSGTYTLVATSGNGCTSTNSIEIAVSFQGAAPEVIITDGTGSETGTNLCEGDAVTLTGEEILDATYSWVGPNNFTSDQRIITIDNVMADDAGAYQLRTTVAGCTSAPRTVGPINVLNEPIANNDDFTVIKDQATTINLIDNDSLLPGVAFTIAIISGTENGVLDNNNDGTLTYIPNDGFGGKDEIAYELCYADCPDLCDMATITLDVGFRTDICVVPTFISPNGDGFNDQLVISCIVGEPKAGSELIVFNEWGSEVYRQERYNNDWAGTYEGEPLPDGTYYYIYKADNDDPDPKKGYITIFR